MPRIDIAMAQSLTRRSVAALQHRGVEESADKIKTTLSSWDNCMAETYCKWPVIGVMIFVGLIIFSIIWCIGRCLCCGLSCCCTCFSCLKCCGNCCGCCDDPRDKKSKHLDNESPSFGAKQGYVAPGGMDPHGHGGGGGWTPGAAPVNSAPSFATFETGPSGHAVDPARKVNDDALPPMPSWEAAQKKRLTLKEEGGAVPLEELDPVTGQKMPLMTGAISRSGTPVGSPYTPNGQFPGQEAALAGGGGMLAAGAAGGMAGRQNDPYNRQNNNNSRGPGSRGPGSRGPGGHASPNMGAMSPAPGPRGYPPSGPPAPYNPSFPADIYGAPSEIGAPNRYDTASPYSANPNRMPSAQGTRNLPSGMSQRPNYGRDNSNIGSAQPMAPAGPLDSGGFNGGVGSFGVGGASDGGYARAESPPPLDSGSHYSQQVPAAPHGGFAALQPGRPPYAGSTAPPSYVSRAPTQQGPQGYGGTRY